jgi:hypothetical protein
MTTVPPVLASIRVVKKFPYRGADKLWGNRYFLASRNTITTADFQAMSDAITAHEQGLFPSYVEIVETIGYNGGSDVPIGTKTYALAGTLATAGGQPAPGDAAACIRFGTTQKTKKNHPIYLFKYFHAVFIDTTGQNDVLLPAQRTALDAYGAAWVSGITYGGGVGTIEIAGPRGAAGQNHSVLPYIRHRDFPD